MIKFHTCSISYWQCHRIKSLTYLLTIYSKYFIPAHKLTDASVTHSGRVLSLSRTARTHTQLATTPTLYCFQSRLHHSSYHQSNSPEINPVDYTICGIAKVVCGVCSKSHWTEAASVRRLVRHGTAYHWQCNSRVVHKSTQLVWGRRRNFTANAVKHHKNGDTLLLEITLPNINRFDQNV